MAGWTAFLRGLPPTLAAQLGKNAAPHQLVGHSMVKLWFGNKDLHYECWLRERLHVIELGLHFESDPLTNGRLLGAFNARSRIISRRLPTARIEEWDRGWARVWEPVELRTLDEPFGAEIAKLLVRYIRVLEPILEAELPADVRWSR